MHGYILNSYRKKDQCDAMQTIFQNTGGHMWRSFMHLNFLIFYTFYNMFEHVLMYVVAP